MVTIDTFPNHAISWVGLAARDLDAAIDFHEGLFGWSSFDDGETPYHLFQFGDQPVAGAMEYTMFSREGEPTAGTMAVPLTAPAEVPSHWDPWGSVLNLIDRSKADPENQPDA